MEAAEGGGAPTGGQWAAYWSNCEKKLKLDRINHLENVIQLGNFGQALDLAKTHTYKHTHTHTQNIRVSKRIDT